MYKSLLIILMSLTLVSCDPATLQKVMDTVGDSPLTDLDISNGLKEALQNGVDNSVNFLSATDGYYRSAYKILLPEQATKVINKLSFIPGFKNLEDEMIKKVNRAAEDAAKKAGPIFMGAIRSITFDDARNILMGNKNAATQFLQNRTYNQLYGEFKPVLEQSLNKVGALDLWTSAITKYNSLPLVNDVNPDLSDHINTKALAGLFDLVEQKEEGIRADVSQRTSGLMQKVFAKQD